MSQPRVLAVTGATGLVGRTLLRAATADGWAVRALTRRPQPPRPGVTWLIGDVTDPAAVDHLVENSNAVVHAAATLHGTPEEVYASIVTGTRHVAAAAYRAAVRLVYLSSLGVVDPALTARAVQLDDSAPRDPDPSHRGAYTRGKVAAEAVVEEQASAGLDATMLRPAQIVGDHLAAVPASVGVGVGPLFMALVPLGLPLAVVHVDDVAAAILLAATAPQSERVVTLVDPLRVTRKDLLARFRRAGVPGSRRPSVALGPLVQPAAEVLGSLPLIGHSGIGRAAARVRGAASRARWQCRHAAALGWRPHHLATWQVGEESTGAAPR